MKINKEELKELVRIGYEKNLVHIIYAEALKDDGCDGIACRIGDHCFYFAGETGEEFENIYDYIRNTTKEEDINNITETILSLNKDGFEDEAGYYYHYLKGRTENIYKALQLWHELEDVPVNENEEIDTPWRNFPKGTSREDIWHWFENTYQVSVAKDLMGN